MAVSVGNILEFLRAQAAKRLKIINGVLIRINNRPENSTVIL
jgi:hypothetical protein